VVLDKTYKTKPEIAAQCCCGKSKLSVSDEPLIYGICHCNNCKQRTGSAFGMSSYFKQAEVRFISDSTSVYYVENELGQQERHFCSSCGTTLYWTISLLPGLLGIAAGCFTESPFGEPHFTTFNHNQCNWLSLAETMKQSFDMDDINRALSS